MKTVQLASLLPALIVLSFLALSNAQWTPDPFCPYPSDHVTRYPYYGNCSLYWECYAGTKYVQECPTGLEFNAPKEQCDTPSIANCDPLATTAYPGTPTTPGSNETHPTDDGTTGPTDATTQGGVTHDPLCPMPGDQQTFYPYPGNCSKYYECYAGVKTEMDCPSGLWWHDAIAVCDYPGNYCSNDGTTAGTTSGTTQSESDDTTPGSSSGTTSSTLTTQGDLDPRCSDGETTYWPHPTDCQKYIECFDGHSYEMDCPGGLYFSDDVKACVNEEDSECCASHNSATCTTD